MSANLADSLEDAKIRVAAVLQTAPDRCAIYSVTHTPDGSGGTTKTETAVGSNIPVIVQERSYRSGQLAGGQVSDVTHDLFILPSAAAAGVKPDYVIVVAARAPKGALRFEQPIVLDESFDMLVKIGAMLKK